MKRKIVFILALIVISIGISSCVRYVNDIELTINVNDEEIDGIVLQNTLSTCSHVCILAPLNRNI